MPDTREFQNNVLSSSSNARPDNHNLDEAMRLLNVEDNYEEVDAYANPYPDRPGELDCIYYMKTGSCGYGSNCRYNHPTYVVQGTNAKGELPERVGQPDCQYFLRTGMCKFGATCKYHHPREREDARSLQLNLLGLPMRQDEKSCSYYMRTGTCKFGVACKFNHPQPATVGSTLSSVAPPHSMPPMADGISAWPLSNRPPYMQSLSAYMPVILPPNPGTLPMHQGWTTYPASSPDVVGHSQTPKLKKNAYQIPPSSNENFPERPDQPECQYYLKTGSCKFGPACKYHHPRGTAASNITLGPLGLPLRPGHAVCSFYSMYGSCRFGSACRFDHPLMGYYNYTMPPAISVPNNLPSFPNQRNPQVAWAMRTNTSLDPNSPKFMKSEPRDEPPLPSDGDEYKDRPDPSHTELSSQSVLNQSD